MMHTRAALGMISARTIYTMDPCAFAAVMLAIVVVPVRFWTISTGSSAPLYSIYPPWLQAWVAAVFIGQVAAEIVGCLDMRRRLAIFAVLAAATSAIVQVMAAPDQGGWVLWVDITVVELLIFYRLSLVKHAREGS